MALAGVLADEKTVGEFLETAKPQALIELFTKDDTLETLISFALAEDKFEIMDMLLKRLNAHLSTLSKVDAALPTALFQHIAPLLYLHGNMLSRHLDATATQAFLQWLCTMGLAHEADTREDTFTIPSLHSPSLYHEQIPKVPTRPSQKFLRMQSMFTQPSVEITTSKWSTVRSVLVRLVDRSINRFRPVAVAGVCRAVQRMLEPAPDTRPPLHFPFEPAALIALASCCEYAAFNGPAAAAVACLRLVHARAAAQLAPDAMLAARICLQHAEAASPLQSRPGLNPFSNLPSVGPATTVVDLTTMRVRGPVVPITSQSSQPLLQRLTVPTAATLPAPSIFVTSISDSVADVDGLPSVSSTASVFASAAATPVTTPAPASGAKPFSVELDEGLEAAGRHVAPHVHTSGPGTRYEAGVTPPAARGPRRKPSIPMLSEADMLETDV